MGFFLSGIFTLHVHHKFITIRIFQSLLLCLMQPLKGFSNMNAVIVVWGFYTKLAILWNSTPVIFSVNHFTCKNTIR